MAAATTDALNEAVHFLNTARLVRVGMPPRRTIAFRLTNVLLSPTLGASLVVRMVAAITTDIAVIATRNQKAASNDAAVTVKPSRAQHACDTTFGSSVARLVADFLCTILIPRSDFRVGWIVLRRKLRRGLVAHACHLDLEI